MKRVLKSCLLSLLLTATAQAESLERSCIPLAQIKASKALDDSTILFTLRGGDQWVSRLPQRCPGLASENAFLYKTSLPSLCQQDLITVLYNGRERGATCGLGVFERYQEHSLP